MMPALAVVSTAPFFLRPSSTTPRCGNTQSPKQALRESTGAHHIMAKDSLRHIRSSGTKNVPTLGLLPMPTFKGMCSPLVQYEHLAHKNKSIPTSPTSSMGHVSGASCFPNRALGQTCRVFAPKPNPTGTAGASPVRKYGQAPRKFHNGEYFLPALTPALEGHEASRSCSLT